MITAKEAFDIVRKKHPDKKCTVGVDHGPYYIFVMLDDDEVKQGYGYDPFYAVKKSNSQVLKYNLSGDEEAFFSDLRKNPIHLDGMISLN